MKIECTETERQHLLLMAEDSPHCFFRHMQCGDYAYADKKDCIRCVTERINWKIVREEK